MVDTCALFDFMADCNRSSEVSKLLSNSQAAISVITIYELFRGVTNQKHIVQRQQLVNLCKILEISTMIAKQAAEIYTALKKKGELIPNQDILIAATSIYWKYPLLTSNKKHFKKIPKIQLT